MKKNDKKIRDSLRDFYNWTFRSEYHFIHSLEEGALKRKRESWYEDWANHKLSDEEYVHLLERGSEDGIGRKARL